MSFLKRWIREEDSALRQQLVGKTPDARFRGLWRSERNETKMFLLAGIPILVTAILLPKWSDANAIEKGIMVVIGAWAVAVSAVGSFYIFRSLIRISRGNHG